MKLEGAFPLINHLQVDTIKQIITYMNDCSHIDLVIRHNGRDLCFEADFLKQLFRRLEIVE